MATPISQHITKKAKLVFLLASTHHSFKKADRLDWYLQHLLEHKPLLQKRPQIQKEISEDLQNENENLDQQPTINEETNETETQSKSQESLNDDVERVSSQNDQQDDSKSQEDASDNEQQQSDTENQTESNQNSDDSENSDVESEAENTEDEDTDSQPFDIYNTLDENEQTQTSVAKTDNLDEYYVEVGFQPYENIAILYAASQDGTTFSQCHTITSKSNLFQDVCSVSTQFVEPSDVHEDMQRNNLGLSTMQLASDSQVFVIYTKYRMVLALDISPSTSLVCETSAGKLIFDNLFSSLQYTLRSAVQPLEFQIGSDSSVKVSPLIYATVTAQGAMMEGFHLLLEGAKITANNVESILIELKQSLYKLKSHFGDSQSNDHPTVSTAQNTLQQILQTSVFALKLMASDAAPMLILINDGVTQLTVENAYDNLLMLLSREDIACYADLDIMTNHASIYGPFAYVPDLDLMKFLCDNTGGQLLSNRTGQWFSLDKFLQGSVHRSSYSNQERLMLRPLHPSRKFLKANVSDTPQNDLDRTYFAEEVLCQDIATLNSFTAIDYPYPWSFGIDAAPPPVPLLPSKLRKYNIEIDPFYLISTRLNEGFFINNCTFYSDSKLPFQFDVQLMYLWQRHIYFVYNIKVQNGTSLIELEILSYYEFLLQFAMCLKQNAVGNVSAAGRFHTFVNNVIECDRVTSYIGAQIIPAMKELYTAHPKSVVHHDTTTNHLNPLDLIQGMIFGITMGFTPTAKPNTAVQNLPASSAAPDSRIKLWKLIVSNIQQATWHRWLQTEKVELLLSPVAAKPLQVKDSAISCVEMQNIGFDSVVSANIDKLTQLLENFFVQRGALISDNRSFLFMLPMSTITFRAQRRQQPATPPHQTTVHGFNIGPSAKQPAPEEQDFNFNKHRFYIIRFVWDCTNMLVIQFAFYCVESSLRQSIIRNFRHEITSPRMQKIVCAILTAPIPVPAAPSFQTQPNPNAVYSYTQAHYVHPPKLEYKFHYDHEVTLLCKDIRSILIRYNLPEPPKKVAPSSATNTPTSAPNALQNTNISQFPSIPALPMVGLLKNYMFYQRWIWHIDTHQTRDMILDLITKATLHEGFILVNSSNTINFVRVISMVNNINLPPEELYRPSNTARSVLQYIVYKVAPQLIITELWMEPQSGYFPIPDSSDKPKFINQHEIFQGICQWLRSRDEHIMSSLCTFDTLLQFAKFVPTPVSTETKQKSVSHPSMTITTIPTSAIPLSHSPITSKVLSPYMFRDNEKPKKEKERESELDDTRATDSVEQRPPFSLGGILGIQLARSATPSMEKTHSEQSYATLKNNQTSGTQSSANELLYSLLKTAVGSLSNCEISLPTDDPLLTSLNLQQCYCFEKVINTESLILTFLWPFQAEEQFRLTFYECSRECLQDLRLLSSTSPLYMSKADKDKSVVISLRQALQESHDQCQHFHGHTNRLHQIYRHHHHVHHFQSRHKHHTKLKGKLKQPTYTPPQRRHKKMKSRDVDESLDLIGGQANGMSVSKLYYESIRASHQRSFVKVVYTNLRDGTPIHFDDFCTAISSCQEYVLKIDITQYIKIVHLQLLEGKGMPEPLSLHVPPHLLSQLSSQAASIQEKFNQLVKKKFQRVPVPGIDHHFYYMPLTALLMSILAPSQQQTFPTKVQPPNEESEIEEIENEEDDDIVDEDEDTPPVSRKKYSNSNDSTSDAWDLEWAFATAPANSKTKPGPSFAQTLKKKLSADEKTSLGVFPFPLFLRLECQIVPDAPSPASAAKSPAITSSSNSLSNSANLQLSGGSTSTSENDNNNDQPHVFSFPAVERFPINTIPTPSTHPTIRADTKIFLRFICVTLPPFKNSVLSQAQSGTPNKRALTQSQSSTSLGATKDALSFHELPLQPLKKIIRDTETSVRYLLSEEILNSLRDSRPVTKHTLDIVVDHMSKLKSQSLSTFTIPLYFLDVREGRKVFPTELETTTFLSLKRIHDVYFIVQKPTAETTEGEAQVKPDNNDSYIIPYWAIITYHQREGLTGDFIKVLFYSNSISNVDKSQLFTEVRTGIRRVCERVNQLFLLHQLHETRYCSPLLVPNATEESPAQPSTPTATPPTTPSVSQKAPPRPVPQTTPTMAQHTVFLPGQFACPLVHTIKLGLHPRVPAIRAVGALISTALHPFSVVDRKNLFVFHEKTGRVFYMKLQDSSAKRKEDSEESSGSGSFGSQLNITGSISNYASMPKSNSASNLNLSDPNMNATLIQRAQFLTLEVFGVDKPSSEITEQLHKLLESKLASITLSLLSTLLERNPHLKLTPEDIEFIRGSILEPSKTLEFTLPPHMRAFSFFKYLKQNLLQYLTLMHSSSDADVRANFLSSFSRKNLSEIAERTDYECNMIYNYITNRKTASPICTAIGQGVAIIRVSLLDSNGTAKEITEDQAINWAEKCTSIKPLEDVCKMESSVTGNEIVVEIWARETLINIQALVTHLTQSVNQTICEFSLESFLVAKNFNVNRLQEELVQPSKSLISAAATLGTPSVTELKADLTVPSWAMHNFVLELQDILSDLNSKLAPVVCFSENVVPKQPSNFLPYTTFLNTNPSNNNVLLKKKGQYQFAIVGGCVTLTENGNVIAAPSPVPQSPAPPTTPSGTLHGTSTGVLSPLSPPPSSTPPNPKKEIELSRYSVDEAMLYPHIKEGNQIIYRNCFVLLTITSSKLELFVYNWNHAKWEQLNFMFSKLKSWVSMRQNLLHNVLHQKLGLFYHFPSSFTTQKAGTTNSETVKFTLDNIDLLLNNPSPARSAKEDSGSQPASGPQSRQQQPAQPAKKKPTSLLNFPTILANPMAFEPTNAIHMSIQDPVKRHGVQLKAIAAHLERISDMKTNLLFLYNSWPRYSQAMLSPSASSYQTLVTPSGEKLDVVAYLRLVMKAANIIACCRCTIMFDQQCGVVLNRTNGDPVFSSITTKSKEMLQDNAWYKNLLAAFVLNLQSNLTSLAFHELKIHELLAMAAPSNTNAQITDPTQITIKDSYFVKNSRGGTILVHLSYDHPYLSFNIFALHGLKHKTSTSGMIMPFMGSETSKHSKQTFMQFAEEFTKPKLSLHTFLFDFHLKKIQQYLNAGEESYPPLEFIKLLNSMVLYYPVAPRRSQSAIICRTITASLTSTLNSEQVTLSSGAELFAYVSNNSRKYRLKSMTQFGIVPGLYLSSDSDGISMNTVFGILTEKDTLSTYSHSVIIFMLPESKNSFSLEIQFYLVRTCSTSSLLFNDSNNTKPPLDDIADHIQSYLLNQVFPQAVLDFKRDMLWKLLVTPPDNNNLLSPLTVEQFASLKNLSSNRVVQDVDPALANLVGLSNLPCPALINHLVSVYGKAIRKQPIKGTILSLVITNPQYADSFLHIYVEEGRNKVHITVSRREVPMNPEAMIFQIEQECSQITKLVNHILFFLWKCLVL